MLSPSIDDIQEQCDAMRGYTPEYFMKQMHAIPHARVVDRVEYILEHCTNKHVLHLGCGWPSSALHTRLYDVTSCLDGVDINVPMAEHTKHNSHGGRYFSLDLDSNVIDIPLTPNQLNPNHGWGVIVVAEILEHLGNPGQLLHHLKYCNAPVLITVPNAFSKVGAYHVGGGVENVNAQHTCYYSYHTLKELVTRYGYVIEDFCWYNTPSHAQPQQSEGLIFLVR